MSILKLRDYQNLAIELVEKSENKNILLQMATGSGKTVVFCEMAKRFYIEHARSVLILVHRIELLKQAYEKLGEKCFKIEAGVKNISANFNYYVGMVETINKRLKQLPDFGLVIIDECHFANFKKMPFFEMQNTKVVGFTATPISEKPLSDTYAELLQPIDIKTLISSKYLVNSKPYGFASDIVSTQNFRVKGGEFDEKEMMDFYSSEKMIKNVVEAYWTHCNGLKTIIFNVNIEHNRYVYNALGVEGLPVYYVDSHCSENERREAIDGFKNDKHGIMCNVGILTTGFDEPLIQAVVLNRATRSLALYLQMLGRGSRPFEHKENFIVVDLGKNTARFGHYDANFDWITFFNKGTKKESKNKKLPPTKECPNCGLIQHTRVLVCENCAYSFEEAKKEKAEDERIQKLHEILRDSPIIVPTTGLIEMAKTKTWSPYAVLHKIADHLLAFERKNKGVFIFENSEQAALIELEKWCKAYDKKNNKWHKDLLINMLNDKRKLHTV